MSTETFTQKTMMSAGLSRPHNYLDYQHQHQHHLYNPAPRLSALASSHLSARGQTKQAKRRSLTTARQQTRQPQPQALHPLTTLLAVIFDFFLRGILDLTRPPRELVKFTVMGIFDTLCWAYHALPMPLALGLLYYAFQSVPDALHGVEELRMIYSTRLGGDAFPGSASGIEGLYGLGEMALVRWGDLGVWSAFYCLALMTAAYAVMVLLEMRDYIRDTWALIVDEALEVQALRADEC
ncbi:hypothetical protein BDP55DRAFT_550872 [Colletotrichum godetiae]|uniref:Uncharacterized protein n=1 Tax=Colletotrichum godetiae TaxID=1209918 RepID=A0AAJ0ALT5_9PEZI|nr:uncharacterized protein BDP55DRAFT_550872 [Colletotrichum godetiae]KAK1676257.1 hypothetical protein BDP55DRAFT_550872 [Colletotrichum godetiae]